MLRPILALLAISFGSSAFAGNAYYSATVTKTLVDDVAYGSCMALVSPFPETKGLDCKAGWVSFSCSGDFNSKEIGYQKLEAAQLAMMTGTKVGIRVDDSKKHNGYCFAQRIDNLPN
ncbi:MAG: hypothetical protein ABJ056_01095 [Halioglobus sp.]